MVARFQGSSRGRGRYRQHTGCVRYPITVAASRLRGDVEHSLFIVAAAVLALVLIGIHNAWDTVTYLAVQQQEQQDTPKS